MKLSYDLSLVFTSTVVAILASYVALHIVGNVFAAAGRSARVLWISGGAVCMGTGIWSMHFVGMLATRLEIEMAFDIGWTLFSLLIAVLVSGFALYLISIERLGRWKILLGGTLMGAGVASMHYVGMAALEIRPGIQYDPVLFALSVLIAISASCVALWLFIRLRPADTVRPFAKRSISAVAMGLAIVGMHYTGMAAAQFAPGTICIAPGQESSQAWLGLTVASFTVLLLGLALYSSLDHMRKLKLAGKISFIMGLGLGLSVAALTSLALYDVGRLDVEMRSVEQGAFVPLQQIRKIAEAAAEAERSLLWGLEANDGARTRHLDAARQSLGRFAALVATYQNEYTLPHEQDALNTVAGSYAPLASAVDAVPAMADSGDGESYAYYRANAAPHFDRIGAAAAALTAQRLEQGVVAVRAGLSLARQSYWELGGVAAIALLIGIAGIVWLVRSLTHPLRVLSSATRAVAAGDLFHSIPVASRDEFGQLSSDFNKMVTDLRRSHEKLAAATNAAESANLAKSDFLANMSHEIRTPMNAIIGLSHLALKTDLTPRQRDYLAKVHAAGQHLLGVINDILDFSRVESGMLALENAEFDLHALLATTCSLVHGECARKGLELAIDLDPGVPARLMGDSLRLGQVLLNFANNAAKFTEQGSVVLAVRATGSVAAGVSLEFQVRDTGIGITPEQSSRLFQSFSQADNSTTRKYGGTGLGLSISKKLVELMGGEVGVDSKFGQGSTFWFRVTLARGRMLAQPEASAPVDAAGPALRHLRGARVLLVEDNDINQIVAREILQEAGMVVEVADDGAIALEMVRKAQYDIVFMDMQMPVMDGLTATREMRGMPHLASLPIIAMTANGMQRDRQGCLDAGMDDVIVKPIDPALLWAALPRWIPPLRRVPFTHVEASEARQTVPG